MLIKHLYYVILCNNQWIITDIIKDMKMGKNDKKRVCHYTSYTDDMVTTSNQEFRLKDNYKWVNNNIFYRISAGLIYAAALAFAHVYCKVWLHGSFKNREVLKPFKKQGYYVYGNHTQPLGDVVIPARACKDRRIYTIVSMSNYGIPVIGKILSRLGALPIPDGIENYKYFYKGVKTRIKQKHPVVIFPEAHVWPYCTMIRPYPETSFRFPVEDGVPAFCMTTTYQKRKNKERPKMTVYIDGPFYPDSSLTSKKAQQKKLHDEIFNCMKKRSELSTYQYIQYEEKIL